MSGKATTKLRDGISVNHAVGGRCHRYLLTDPFSITPDETQLRILLVEDAEGMRKIVARMLTDFDYDDLMMATNGKEALELMDA